MASQTGEQGCQKSEDTLREVHLTDHRLPYSAESAVRRTIRQLTQMSLATQSGSYLGSESELLQQLGVSRPTLRQAAKVMESDRLLSVRRGVNGGFYADRPDGRHVVQQPALWLRLQNATMEQMNRASSLLLPEASAQATACSDPELIEALVAFRDRIGSPERAQETHRETVRAEVEFARLIARMSGDPVMMLFIDICYSFGLLERDFHFYRQSPQRRHTWLELQLSCCDAILSGDADVARLISQRRGKVIAAWISDDRTAAAKRTMSRSPPEAEQDELWQR